MYADYILKSNAIFDSCSDKPFSGFIAVCDNKISCVSAEIDEMSKWQGSDTKVLDYGDKLIIPGFGESHAHAFYGALEIKGANVIETLSEEEAAETIYLHEKDNNPSWVIAFGWNHEYWKVKELPNKKSLDKYFPDTPVVVINEELHGMWVNSKALEVCGITRDTTIPAGMGMIEKNADGEPTGYLLETPAMKMVLDKAFVFTPEEEKALIDDYFKYTASMGITSISNLQIHEVLMPEVFEMMEKAGKLNARMSLVASINEDLDVLKEMQKKYTSDKLKFGGVKGFADGTPMGYTGTLIEEYSDRPGFYGECYMTVDTFGEKAIALEENDIRMRIHACGDGAVRNTLEIFEHAQKEAPGHDLRHTIEHIEVIHPDDMGRLAKAGVIASVQPDHMWSLIFDEHPFHKILGPERSQHTYPFKSLLNEGTKMAFGSDHPIAELNPMKGLYRAVTRLAEDRKPNGGWSPWEKLTLAEAITAYTAGSAYQMYNEDITGTLEEGKLADIVVMDRNLFTVDLEEILEATPIMTMLDGKIIFQA